MPEQVRVLHVMWRMSIGGAERAVFQLVREQRRRGIEADLVVASERGFYGEEAAESGARVHLLGCRSALDVRRSLALTSLASEYEIVHHHGIEPLLIAATSRARGPKLVYTHRGGVRGFGAKKRFRTALARRRLRRFRALSANTAQGARALANLLDTAVESIAVVYNGVDFDLLRPIRSALDVQEELPDAASGPLLVATAANLQDWKRVDRLLRSVVPLVPEIHCLILGDGPARTRLESVSNALGLQQDVTFLGRKKNVGDYLQLTDIFVLPSGPQEGFGNAAVEAMSLGIPTIVFSDGGGLTEHVTDRETGRVVDSEDELTRAMGELAADERMRHLLGSRGQQFVRARYSLDAMLAGYGALYESARARS